MNTFVYALVLLLSWGVLSTPASAKEASSGDIRYTKGVLKRITCRWSGIRTQTGAPLASINFPDPDNTVCDPLSNGSSDSASNGLLGKLIVQSSAMNSNNKSVMEFYNNGTAMTQKMYFADVDVPTKPFTQGFSTASGQILVDAQGNKLIENFAIEYNTILQLAAGDAEGDYEVASLADDGALVFVWENNAWQELINNDGQHPTRMGCPYRTIHLTRSSQIPMKILYYQGPRYYIANVLIWKKLEKARTRKKVSRHSLCGYEGNNYFFNPDTGKNAFGMNFLEKRGWKVLAAANYKMPVNTSNPCTVPVPDLTISNFAIKSMSGTSAVLGWDTNLAASSQLHITNIFTGEEIYTDLDSTLVTSHTANLGNLVSGMYYQVQAISVDEKGREVRSGFIDLAP